ncbi:uncharacterized protein DNG_03396 [Cephalotrichum gorgonifer]|uniref:Uncharacterized protein n=1 Tax=Cephalotrichum gorgonifer TaxID=2041049 RepID=A0AAE8MV13_9PEZI|nr:uncharacterized protein DNG_03396 [Cephalotrichum gorgonifer]
MPREAMVTRPVWEDVVIICNVQITGLFAEKNTCGYVLQVWSVAQC